MSMVAFVLAAGLAQASAAPGDRFAVEPRPTLAAGSPCPPLAHKLRPIDTRSRPEAGPSKPRRSGPQRLGDMPKANLTLTVLRSVDGCAVSSTVRYEVEGDGRAPQAKSE